MPPDDTISLPPLDTTVKSAEPPRVTSCSPPVNRIVPEACALGVRTWLPPLDTLGVPNVVADGSTTSKPPFITVASVAVPPLKTTTWEPPLSTVSCWWRFRRWI